MEEEEKATKIKRNSEKRKEKSRYAAKCRRNKESEIFSSLAKALPVKESWTHLDKATIMRLGIAYLRIRKLFSETTVNKTVEDENDKLSLVALGGIMLVLSLEGDTVYVSSNVSVYLGLSQIELMGQNIFDVTHPCDHKDIKNILFGKNDKDGHFSLFVRMKSTLNNKGRSSNLKSATYKVMHLVGTMLRPDDDSSGSTVHFAAIGSPIPHPANIETPLGSYTFLSKHSLDMKFTYGDERMKHFLGYSTENLIGKSLYEFHHVSDTDNIQASFKSLFSKGQSETDHYRFLVKGGGYVWVTTQATVIYSDRASKPESVVCVNFILSERLNGSEIYSAHQLDETKTSDTNNKPVSSTTKVIVKITPPEKSERPQHATSKIFAPRTPEMNKGFLTFADDDSGCTILKDEPDDLTHLAPTPGDVCISLEGSPFNNSLVDEFGTQINDDYSPLLNQHHNKLSFLTSALDDASSSCLSPALSKSPMSLPSLCSTRDDTLNFEDTSVKTFLSMENDDSDDFSFKAPYIPMSEGDDLPLLMNYDYWASYSSCNSSVDSSCATTPMECSLSDDSANKILSIASTNDPGKSIEDHGGGIDSLANDTLSASLVSVEIESRKRNNMDLYSNSSELFESKKRKCPDRKKNLNQSSSVLKNLLVIGHDVNAGYTCINTRKNAMPDKTSQLSTNS